MEPSSTTSGSAVRGQHHSNPSIPYKKLFLILVAGRSSSCVTMSQWWLFCLLAPPFWQSNLMVLMHFLALLAVHHSFSFKASSVCGRANPVADALSCFQFQQFRCLAPQAALAATQFLWISSCMALFRDIVLFCRWSSLNRPAAVFHNSVYFIFDRLLW